ncbi:hypothetical protein BAB79_15140 [Mycobacteroides abscessus]|nr:hypothetical protein A3O06_15145 [Mycobacteroides abscessus]ANO24746.1 hypothetical protein BAB79_15140 [Mycobacteroides abscessus]
MVTIAQLRWLAGVADDLDRVAPERLRGASDSVRNIRGYRAPRGERIERNGHGLTPVDAHKFGHVTRRITRRQFRDRQPSEDQNYLISHASSSAWNSTHVCVIDFRRGGSSR